MTLKLEYVLFHPERFLFRLSQLKLVRDVGKEARLCVHDVLPPGAVVFDRYDGLPVSVKLVFPNKDRIFLGFITLLHKK